MLEQRFQYVEEGNEAFLSLFPHRFDYIYAEYPQPGCRPDWRTESRHPLSDRLVAQAAYLFGVRFGAKTQYCLLDIDRGSAYHPQRDPLAIHRLVAALDPLGLVSYLACTSSDSGGLHLYFPFAVAQQSWELASAVITLLEHHGFKVAPGQLEVFPNLKPYRASGQFSLFNAHRLPLQVGSFLLNTDFQPIWGDRSVFVQRWQFAVARNDVTTKAIRRILKQIKRKPYQVSSKAEKFLNDLNTEIELGWTGYGQTNRLLGRIAMRTYVFHHVLFGGEPLTEQALVDQIILVARSLPGYQEWCRHQHEIAARAAEWARCVEASRYFPYSSRKRSAMRVDESLSSELSHQLESSEYAQTDPNDPHCSEGFLDSKDSIDPASLSWNKQQSLSVRTKIQQAIVHLLETNTLPAGATARFKLLTGFGISGSSLYRHRDLWHPACLTESPQTPDSSLEHDRLDCGETSNGHCSPSLFPSTGCNASPQQSFSQSGDRSSDVSGCNALPTQPLLHISPLSSQLQPQKIQSQKIQSQASNSSWQQQDLDQRMQQYLASGDPILVAEAKNWFNQKAVIPVTDRSPQDRVKSDKWVSDSKLGSSLLSESALT
ncbi:MAG TPA: hypothetical protein V6C65_13095, partial [Allocoleopsis sp.]